MTVSSQDYVAEDVKYEKLTIQEYDFRELRNLVAKVMRAL